MAHHLRLTHGLSYMGAVFATKANPDVFVDDEVKYTSAMESGYFEEITDSEDGSDDATVSKMEPVDDSVVEPVVESGEEVVEDICELDTMTVSELKGYAEINGIDISGHKKREDILAAIKEAESKAEEARKALRGE